MRKFIGFILTLIVFESSIALASEKEWLRIINPDAQLRSQLASKSIEYGNFLWVKKDQAQNIDLSRSSRIDKFTSPYDMVSGDSRIDLANLSPDTASGFNDLSSDEYAFHLVQFKGPIKSEWLVELKEIGIKPIKPMASFSYIVWANKPLIDAAKSLESVRWSGYFYSVFKLQPDNRQLDATLTSSMALVYKPKHSAIVSEIQILGGTDIISRNIDNNFMALTFNILGSHYPEFSEIPGVLTIQKVSLDGGPRGEMSQQSVIGNLDENNDVIPGYINWLNQTGLDGTGVVVGIVDGGIYNNHPDLSDNMLDCLGPGPSCGDDVDGHGSHVAGAVAGSGSSGVTDNNGFLRGQGVAPNAKVVEQLYGPLLDFGQNGVGGMVAGGMLSIYKDSAMSGAMLTNNSWGPTGTPQGYDIPTMEIDMISRDADPDNPGNQPVLAVWSIMNGNGDRSGSCSPSSLGSPDEAKNLFAVGSTKLQNGSLNQINSIFDVSSNSAHGPACDGRLIPHIVAPGCSTDGPVSSSGYGTLCGTSMASPVVSGSVSLFWQQYKQNNGIDPSPALVKATFTAIAQNLQGFDDADGSVMGQAPDRKQGWGRLDLDSVVNPKNKVWYFDQNKIFYESGDEWNKTLYPDDSNQPVRLMLVWTDAAAAGLGGTSEALVNDLDLSVSQDTQVYKGNVFGSDAFSATGGDFDDLNNMEGVFIKSDDHNGQPIEVSVLAANIIGDALNPYESIQPAQDFALVCYNCTEVLSIDAIFANGFEVIRDLIFNNSFE